MTDLQVLHLSLGPAITLLGVSAALLGLLLAIVVRMVRLYQSSGLQDRSKGFVPASVDSLASKAEKERP